MCCCSLYIEVNYFLTSMIDRDLKEYILSSKDPTSNTGYSVEIITWLSLCYFAHKCHHPSRMCRSSKYEWNGM